MKNLKKLSGILLAIAVLLACTVSAFAASTAATQGKITVDNPIGGLTYTAYRIFDVTYTEPADPNNKTYAYTIYESEADTDWYKDVKAYANNTTGSGDTSNQIQLVGPSTDSSGKKFYTVKKLPNFSEATFANYLKGKISGKTGGIELTGTTTKEATVDIGYYLVTTGTGALANLTTNNPNVIIHDKNDFPFKKTANQTTVNIGDVVTYTIEGKVPDTTGFTSFTYQITDKMSDGLTFNENVAVQIGSTDLTVTPVYAANGFTLDIPVVDHQDKIGQKITVTYSATVNDTASGNVEENKANLEYTNGVGTTTFATEQKIPVYSAKIIIDKFKAGENSTKLPGAVFVLKNDEGKYYKYTAENGTDPAKVEFVDIGSVSIKEAVEANTITAKTTNGSGAETFEGLRDGTYTLVEIKAPDGYNMLADDDMPQLTINGATATTANVSALNITKEVANSTGSLLPSTGGIGTTIFYIVGGVLVAAAVVLLVAKKRTSENR